MSDAAAQIQQAVYAELSADQPLGQMLAGDGIYDLPPATAPFPYVTFGRTSVYDWSTASENGTEHLLTIHVWSQAKGKKQSLEIMERLETLLRAFQPALTGLALISFRLEYSEVRFDDNAYLHHGLMRYRALVEETAP